MEKNLKWWVKSVTAIYKRLSDFLLMKWWKWRESDPLHQNHYKLLILLNNIILKKSIMGQVNKLIKYILNQIIIHQLKTI